MTDDPAADGPVLLFDGVCNLCNGVVQFVIRHDPEGRFRFAPLQSEAAGALLADCDGAVAELLADEGVPAGPDADDAGAAHPDAADPDADDAESDDSGADGPGTADPDAASPETDDPEADGAETDDPDADGPTTVILVEDGRCYAKSDAALRVAARLGLPYSALAALRVVPRPVRDAVYDVVAANRYDWFGRREACMVPEPGVASRFLE